MACVMLLVLDEPASRGLLSAEEVIMKRSSIVLGVTVSLLSLGAFAATKEGSAPAEKPAATAPAAKKSTKKGTKHTETKKPAATENSGS